MLGNVAEDRFGDWEKGKRWVQLQMNLLDRQEIWVQGSCKQLNILVWSLGDPALGK